MNAALARMTIMTAQISNLNGGHDGTLEHHEAGRREHAQHGPDHEVAPKRG